ncbi:MAG TPA: glycosyltransferase family 4 protein [Solirubrobacteraceae bacterium]|jgi:phosphatidylinositol alpha-1,6-mannosyltransferase|nr:glycosyltransferase family 4 protein [Solirubrobacteraceae bacterium]
MSGEGGRGAPRLLVLTPDLPPARGGIQALMEGLLGSISRFEVRVVALDSPGAREFDRAQALDVHRVSAPPRLGAGRNLVLDAASIAHALRWHPDVTLASHIVASPAAAAITTLLHAPHATYYHANEIVGKPRLAAWAARTDAASIVVSGYTESLLAAAGGPAGRMHRIPPGVTLPADVRRTSAERPTLVTVSRLADAYKGHDVLLRALPAIRARVPDVEWVVIGDGPLRRELQQRAQREGLGGAVRFLGAVGDAERDAWLLRADVFAMPSRLPGGGLAGEGFGIVFLEAAARGLPVVAGNVGGAVDSVADGETGLLVDPADPGAVAQAVSSLLLDPALARRLGEAGARRAAAFAWPLVAARVEELLLGLLEPAGVR